MMGKMKGSRPSLLHILPDFFFCHSSRKLIFGNLIPDVLVPRKGINIMGIADILSRIIHDLEIPVGIGIQLYPFRDPLHLVMPP